jgi:hypothetical protein
MTRWDAALRSRETAIVVLEPRTSRASGWLPAENAPARPRELSERGPEAFPD